MTEWGCYWLMVHVTLHDQVCLPMPCHHKFQKCLHSSVNTSYNTSAVEYAVMLSCF